MKYDDLKEENNSLGKFNTQYKLQVTFKKLLERFNFQFQSKMISGTKSYREGGDMFWREEIYQDSRRREDIHPERMESPRIILTWERRDHSIL